MTPREEYIFENVIERHNQIVIQLSNTLTENATLREEINNLKAELSRTYRELSELKGLPPETPGEKDLKDFLLSNKTKV